jgi:hypothetical protein
VKPLASVTAIGAERRRDVPLPPFPVPDYPLPVFASTDPRVPTVPDRTRPVSRPRRKVQPALTASRRRYAEAEERWQRNPARAALLLRNARAGTSNSGRDVLDLAKARRVRREHRGPPSSYPAPVVGKHAWGRSTTGQ